MKRLLFTFWLTLSALLVFSQSTPTNIQRTDDYRTVVDNYLVALKRLGIPTAASDVLDGTSTSQNTIKIIYNTTLGKLRGYNPATETWFDVGGGGGDFLPISGNSGNPMTGDIYLGNRYIREGSSGTSGSYLRLIPFNPILRLESSNNNIGLQVLPFPGFQFFKLSNPNGSYVRIGYDSADSTMQITSAWSGGGGNVRTNVRFYTQVPLDSRALVANYHGSVLGWMSDTSGNGSGYPGYFTTQPYVDELSFGIANNSGVEQFRTNKYKPIRFQGTGDANVAFNAATNTVTINSTGGSSGGGGVESWNARTGDVVPEAGDYTTTLVTEGTNQYFTQARVRSTPLTGLSPLNSPIADADNVLSAFGKTQGQITHILGNYVPTTRSLHLAEGTGITVNNPNPIPLQSDISWTVGLATVGTAGTYTKVTTDAYGRVTSGTSLAAGDLPSSVYQTLSLGATAGNIAISNGNAIALRTLVRDGVQTGSFDDWWATTPSGAFGLTGTTTGSTGFPSTTGQGIYSRRTSGTNLGSFVIYKANNSGDALLYYNAGTGASTWSGWKIFADRAWVTSQLPTDYVNTTGNQSGIAGNKSWTDNHIFGGVNGLTVSPTGNTSSYGTRVFGAYANTSGPFVILTSQSSNSATAIIRGYATSGVQMILNEGGIDFANSITSVLYYGGTPRLNFSAGNTVIGASGGVYLRPSGTGSTTNQAIFSSDITLAALSGTGTQMVVANASGVLSRQPIPSGGGGDGTVTSVGATVTGAALNVAGSPITASGTLAFTWGGTTSQYVNGAGGLTTFPTIPTVNNATLTLSTGTGLSGSASFTANSSTNTTFTVAAASGYTIPTSAQVTTWTGKQDAISGGASTITSANLTVSRALTSNTAGKVTVSTTTATELGYLSGTTSNVQTQLDSKAPTTHTHTWTQLSGGSTGLIPGAGSSGTYGSLTISGSKGSYSGIEFTGPTNSATFMIRNSDNLSGLYSGSWIWGFNASGALAYGTVPYSRVTGAPTIPTDYVNTTGAQTGIAGNKGWTGTHTFSTLSGTGTRMVVANASGVLSTATIPAVGVTNVESGAHLTGGPITSTGTLSLQFQTNSYVNDNQSNPRLYFGNNSSEIGFLARASATNQNFQFRNSANTVVWAVGNTGVLSIGTVPYSNISGTPTIGNGTLTLNTGTGLSGGVTSFSANQTGNATFTVAAASGYSIPTTGQISNWNTAYGWGNHAGAGYWSKSYVVSQRAPTGSSVYDANTDFPSGGFVTSYGTGNWLANGPTTSDGYGGLITFSRDPDFTGLDLQFYYRAGHASDANSGLWFRTSVGTTTESWRSWREVYTSANVTGAVTTVLTNNLTASRALISNSSGKVAVSAVTSTELGYLGGVTSNVQTQLNSKVPVTNQITTGDGLSGGGPLSASLLLEVDNTVVRTSGTQSISGTKTLNSAPIAPNYYGTATTLSSTIPTNAQSIFTTSRTTNATYTLSNLSGNPRHIQVVITNTGTNNIFITFTGGTLAEGHSNRVDAGCTGIFTFLIANGAAYGTKTLFINE